MRFEKVFPQILTGKFVRSSRTAPWVMMSKDGDWLDEQGDAQPPVTPALMKLDTWEVKCTLVWHPTGSSQPLTWEQAKTYVLTLGNDWRMPTIHELVSLVDYEKNRPMILGGLECEDSTYWAGTVYYSNSRRGWAVSFSSGSVGSKDLTSQHYLRCVKDNFS